MSEAEAAQFGEYAAETGEVEAALLKRAVLRGIQELRLEQAILFYLDRHDSEYAAQIARLPRAIFLKTLMDKGVVILDEPPMLLSQLGVLAERYGNERLAAAVREVAEEDQCAPREVSEEDQCAPRQEAAS